MSDAGKTILVTKVFDEDCDICKEMSRHDSVVFAEFPEITYQNCALDEIINHNGDQIKLLVCQSVEKYALNPDYTVDLPVYVFLDKTGKYRGHHQGAATIVELRDIVKEIVQPSE